jgi:hypothetical protein
MQRCAHLPIQALGVLCPAVGTCDCQLPRKELSPLQLVSKDARLCLRVRAGLHP